ncbi:hypothetical protein AVEN_165448-1 [Araneus ventricosus]|uniref:Uncharacterized protein n=1 Tax=Araneus ventricosus TaxID=182803 RepID=A0A4Y2HVA3_ARAVE|nr:hypothetical protein AVEN_165448-1 [Araneus ventricosus]
MALIFYAVKDMRSTRSSGKISGVLYTNSSMNSQKRMSGEFMFGQHGNQKCSNVQSTAGWIGRRTGSCLKVSNSHGKVFQGTIRHKSYDMVNLGQD